MPITLTSRDVLLSLVLALSQREMETMKGLNHENIVQFVGYVKEKGYLSLILEYERERECVCVCE
jgi:serine/threonine protein kinase